MQSSIWKLVTAVGIIGIGTLVVLEVQHRLPQQRTVPVSGTEGDQPLAENGSPAQENDFVPAADSEFDQLFASASDGSGLSEPPEGAGSEAPGVDNQVRRNELTSEPSPFAFEEPGTEATASADPEKEPVGLSRITPVAFQENSSAPGVAPSNEAGSSAEPEGTPTLSFGASEPAANPFPQEDSQDNAAATANPPESSSASTPAAGTSTTDESIMFFPGQSESSNNSGTTAATPAAAPTTAEGTKSAFPADGESIPNPGSVNPTPPPTVSAQAGDGEVPAFDFGSSPEPPAAGTPAANPFSPSPFSDDEKPAPTDEQPTPAFPAFDEAPPGSGLSEPVPANPRRDPRNPLDVEPQPFERDQDAPIERELESTQPGRSTRPSLPERTPAATDETFDGGALPFVPDEEGLDSDPRTPDRNPPGRQPIPENPPRGSGAGDSGASGSGSGRPRESDTDTGTDFPPLPGIEVPGPRDPMQPRQPAGSGDDSGLDPFPPGDSPVTAEAQILRPHLTVEKKAPETASVGIPLDYTIIVSNEGESAAADVIVEDELSRGVDLQTTSPTADYDERTRLMTWRIAELGPRESREIRVRVIPTGEGTLNGVATVRFKAQVKASTLITAPKLSIELNCPQEVRAGDQVEMKYTVRNNGSGDARAVLLRSVLPENLRHPEGNDLEYEIEVLRAGEEQEVTLTVVAAERGECLASAELSTTGIQPVSTEARINVVGELLKIERLGPERRYVGRASQFQNIITNITNFEATNVVVMELVPEGMKFVSASEAGEYNPADRLITWKIARIEPNQQVLLDVELTPEHAGSMDSIVQVVENAGFKSQAVKTVAVEDLHNIGADVSQIKGPVAVGEKFTFAITIDNRGTANATNVQLSVQLPKQLKVLAAGSKEQGIEGRPAPGNAVHFKAIQEVPPNSTKTFQLVLQGQEPVRNGVIKAELSYREMTESLVVSESVTVFSDAP